MKKKKHAQIIELMEKKQVISVKELAQTLDCTEMTIRRNLDELQDLGFVQREHGFARLLQTEASLSLEEQKRLARKHGENAQTKILFPMVLMLGVVMLMLMVPAFMGM